MMIQFVCQIVGRKFGPKLIDHEILQKIVDAEPWKFIPWLTIDIHGYPWITMNIHGIPWVYMENHGYPWLTMDIHG